MSEERMNQFQNAIEEAPVIAAIKDEEGLNRALESECRVVFLLYGTLLNVQEQVLRVHKAEKLAIIHADLIEGLSGKEIAADYLANVTHADGVISTRPGIVRRARELGIISIQRFFLLDSLALANFQKYAEMKVADAIEVLPATMPKILRKITADCRLPIIAGGLISDKEDVMLALQSGAAAVSSTNQSVWTL